MILTLILGSSLLFLEPAWLNMPWMKLKLFAVLLLVIYHFYCHHIYKKLQNNEVLWTSQFLRIFNELATLLLFAIGAMGSIVVFKVGRIDLPLVFLATFGGLEFIRTKLYLGWPLDHFTHQMTNGTLLLFAFFMITDPKTTPNSRKARLIWAALLGLATFLLSTQMYIHTAPIWVLFFITPVTVLLDYYFKQKKFEW